MGILAGSDPRDPRLSRRSVDDAFVEVVGERIALLGRESGELECWMWPLKVFHGLRVDLHEPGSDEPLPPASFERRTEVTPGGLAFETSGDGWRVRQELFACLDRRGAVLLLEIEGEHPLEARLRLECDFRPMWPAGLGGQIARVDERTGALFLTEELGRFAFQIGSPSAELRCATRDHGLPAGALELRIALDPRAAPPRPVVFAGAELEPRSLSEDARRGFGQSALGLARAEGVVAAARGLWLELLVGWAAERERVREHWREHLGATTTIETADPRFDEAFLWSKVAIERAWACVDGLGRGLVAGLAPSAGTERPGYGWFFDGDALAASRAMAAVGDFRGAREVFRFAAAHQRNDGKLMHELTLSARLCDWVESYPYAYYKGVNNADFVACLERFVRASGDLETLGELWSTVEHAIDWCGACRDAEGRLSNRKAGIAAVEAGPLSDRIECEIFLHGAWLAALAAGERMARVLERTELAKLLGRWRARAEDGLETFWSPAAGRYGFAHLRDGSLCDDLSVYLALPLARGFGEPGRARATAMELNHPAVASDWGVRMFATDSELYDPAHYNTGAVFPYLTNFATLAQFAHGWREAGEQLLASQVALCHFGALGFVQEHLVGDIARVPARGVPHQLFSSAAIVESILVGLFGVEPDALEGRVRLRPVLPADWDHARLRRLRVGATRLDVELTRTRLRGESRLRATFVRREGPALRVRYEPLLPPLSRVLAARVDGRPADAATLVLPTGAVRLAFLEETLDEKLVFEADAAEGPSLVFAPAPLAEGAPSQAPRVTKARAEGDELTWELRGPAGTEAILACVSDRPLRARGARLTADGDLRVAFPPGAEGSFPAVTVVLRADPP